MYSIDLASQVDQIKDGPTRALRRSSAVPAMYSIDFAGQVDQIKDGPTRALRRFSAVPAMYSIDLVSQVDQIKDGPTRALCRFSAVPAMYSIDFASQVDLIKDGPTRDLRRLSAVPAIDAECPAGHGCKHDHHCHCLFEDKALPLAAAAKAGNPYYGTNCDMEWDSMPGTICYEDAPTGDKTCFGEHGDHCSKECNWRHAHFCYVEMGCEGLPAEDVVLSEWSEELAAGAEEDVKEVGYSYAMCQYANCHGDHYDTSPECPFGEDCLTCGMVKKDYKEDHCCGHPEQHIIIHHMYHKMGEFH